jgi:hypothetical protein
MPGRRTNPTERAGRLLQEAVNGNTVRAVCLLKYGGEVVSLYPREFRYEAFNVMARENVALAKRRSVRNPSLGKPRYLLHRYEKLTIITLTFDGRYILYGICSSKADPARLARKLESVGKKAVKTMF